MIEAARDRGIELEGCCCSSATEAIERLEAGERPRLILFDLRLPGMSGIDFLKILKSKPDWREIPAIAYSAGVSSNDARLVYGLGANCVVNKPKDFEELKDLVRLLEEFWLKWVVYHEP
jgi:CheY-like chemotaxis protein